MSSSITLTNARILDLATGQAGEVGAVHVVEGRLARTPAPAARRIDAGGGFVIPGLWDAHVHFPHWAQCARWIDVSHTRSAEQAAELLSRGHSSDPVLIGFGFRDSLWPAEPSTSLLDEAMGERPTVVMSGDFHSVWVNSAAINVFDLPATEGLLREDDAFEAQKSIARVPEVVLDEWIRDAGAAAAALGVVGIVDLNFGWNPGLWPARTAAGFDTLRVRTGIYPEDLDRAIAEGLSAGMVLDDTGLVTMGPLKVISDGSLTARTAWCRLPYLASDLGAPVPGHPNGINNVTPEQLTDVMTRATGQGLSCAIHAIGDLAVAEALSAFETSGAHGSIEHAQLLSTEDISTMARLGVRASVQPAHLLDDRDAMDTLWADRTGGVLPLATMARAGVELALGSDAPVSPLNPWLAIEVAVRRTSGERPPWHPEQSLTLSQALMASTRGVGSLVIGADADLAVLGANPFEVPIERMHTMRAELTLLGGRLTHLSDTLEVALTDEEH